MPCYLLRANKLRLKVPKDEAFERDVMKAVGSSTHEELEGKVWKMNDEEFIRLIAELVAKRKKKSGREAGRELTAYA